MEALRHAIGEPLTGTDRLLFEHYLTLARGQLQESDVAAAWAQGSAMTAAQAIAYALEPITIPQAGSLPRPPPAEPQPSLLSGLSKREFQVLRLVAQGLTDAQVAEQLVLSPRTVNAHLASIYSKLGVNSRTAATRLAFEHGLV